jgi:hypothetical protein
MLMVALTALLAFKRRVQLLTFSLGGLAAAI